MEFVTATYRLRCQESEAHSLARQIALEQTVEVPEELLENPATYEHVLGQVRTVMADPSAENSFVAVIDYPRDVAGRHLAPLWNLLYGNISLKRQIRLIDVDFGSFAEQFRGPRYGIAGLRQAVGVHARPMLATALKPRGIAPERLAAFAYEFAAGGGDLVKDDHNLLDRSFAEFCQRVDLCQTAIERAADETGRAAVYAPNLMVPAGELPRYAEYLVQRGVRGALVAPMLLGFDVVRELTDRFQLFVLAHPTFTGCYFHDADHGVEPRVLLGDCFRLMGCDATVFPNYSGRFSFSQDECLGISEAARRPWKHVAPCWPAPAGGMSFERLPDMAAAFGYDTMFLIGGALLGDSADLRQSTRRFLDRIVEFFPQHQTTPTPALGRNLREHGTALNGSSTAFVSACELPSVSAVLAEIRSHLPFQDGFRWEGRPVAIYKADQTLPFRGVTRTELIGKYGEQTDFDIRFFDIEPGGFSSLEKHEHTHAIFVVRGTGTLTVNGERLMLRPFDLAYVPPLAVHQLRNEGDEPFGFLCVVDHQRDRPQPAHD